MKIEHVLTSRSHTRKTHDNFNFNRNHTEYFYIPQRGEPKPILLCQVGCAYHNLSFKDIYKDTEDVRTLAISYYYGRNSCALCANVAVHGIYHLVREEGDRFFPSWSGKFGYEISESCILHGVICGSAKDGPDGRILWGGVSTGGHRILRPLLATQHSLILKEFNTWEQQVEGTTTTKVSITVSEGFGGRIVPKSSLARLTRRPHSDD